MFSSRAISVGLLGCLLAALSGAGCPYGFSASVLPGHVKSVTVKLPENRTPRSDLGTALADSLVEAFLRKGTLKVADEKSADSAIEITLLRYDRRPSTYDSAENVKEYRLDIVAEASFVDLRKNQVLWEEKQLTAWSTYNFVEVGGKPAETEEIGIGRVVALLTDDIVNRTLEGW